MFEVCKVASHGEIFLHSFNLSLFVEAFLGKLIYVGSFLVYVMKEFRSFLQKVFEINEE